MNQPLVEIINLRVIYKTERAITYALNGVNLNINKGESLGLVGESGAGKTTTALSLLNLLPESAAHITAGDVKYKGRSVFGLEEKELRKIRGNEISMIFQNPLTSLNPVFTIGEQISMVLREHKGYDKKTAIKEAGKLLETVGIASYRLSDYPHQFSGGMRQRVGIAASLACNPELLIADEPTTALDVTIQAQILELMKNLQTKYSTSLLMITHNLGIISELCQDVAVMYAGQIIEYGKVSEVFKYPAHPYTKGLLGAIPRLDVDSDRLEVIPGNVANAHHLSDGCKFCPRCSHCSERCSINEPAVYEINENHFVACFLASKEGE